MLIRISPARIAAALGLAVLAGGCDRSPATLSVDHAWVRLAAVPGRPAAAYFTLHGGAAPARLIAVTSDVALRSEMHQSMTGARGMTTMAPVDAVAVPAHGPVTFAPGGRHVMLFGVSPRVKPGDTMQLTFTFADSTRIPVDAPTVAAGDPAPDA